MTERRHALSCWACYSSIAHTPDRQWIILPTSSVYCSEDCSDEWEEYLDSTSRVHSGYGHRGRTS